MPVLVVSVFVSMVLSRRAYLLPAQRSRTNFIVLPFDPFEMNPDVNPDLVAPHDDDFQDPHDSHHHPHHDKFTDLFQDAHEIKHNASGLFGAESEVSGGRNPFPSPSPRSTPFLERKSSNPSSLALMKSTSNRSLRPSSAGDAGPPAAAPVTLTPSSAVQMGHLSPPSAIVVVDPAISDRVNSFPPTSVAPSSAPVSQQREAHPSPSSLSESSGSQHVLIRDSHPSSGHDDPIVDRTPRPLTATVSSNELFG